MSSLKHYKDVSNKNSSNPIKSLRTSSKRNHNTETTISYTTNTSKKLDEIIKTKLVNNHKHNLVHNPDIQRHKNKKKLLPTVSPTNNRTDPDIEWECSLCSYMNLSIMASCKICSHQKTHNNDKRFSNNKIFAVFVCGPDPTQNEQDLNSRNLRGQTYIDLLQDTNANNEEWREYMIYKNEFPSNDEMHKCSGIVISGSKYDSYTNDAEWKLKLQAIIRDIYYNQRKIKLLGICFGHQIIIHSLREKEEIVVGRNSKRTSMELGLFAINLNDKFDAFWARYNVKISDELLWIHEAHNDIVFKMPENVVNNDDMRMDVNILAYSQYTDNEMYHIGDYILGVQGHPEFSTDYLSKAIVTNQKGIGLDDDEMNAVLDTMKLNKPSVCEWKYMLKTWLRA